MHCQQPVFCLNWKNSPGALTRPIVWFLSIQVSLVAMAVIMVPFLAVLVAFGGLASGESYAIIAKMYFLFADGRINDVGYMEGETGIILCLGIDPLGGDAPFDVEFQWRRHGGEGFRTRIADGDQIVFVDADRNRFSDPSLTYIAIQNKTEYRITVSDIDRYDIGNTFSCEFSEPFPSGYDRNSHNVANLVKVKWSPPSAQCTTSVAPASKTIKGGPLSYYCSVTDDDRESSGSVTLWRGGIEMKATDTDTSTTPLTRGSEYNITYNTQVTKDSKDVVCRYSGTGGYEEYKSNCTFDRLSCVVDDMADPCLSRGAVPSSDRFQIMAYLCVPILMMMYWI